jgi:hypothetical protein
MPPRGEVPAPPPRLCFPRQTVITGDYWLDMALSAFIGGFASAMFTDVRNWWRRRRRGG